MKKIKILLLMSLVFIMSCVPLFANDELFGVLPDFPCGKNHSKFNDYIDISYKKLSYSGKYITMRNVYYFDRENLKLNNGFNLEINHFHFRTIQDGYDYGWSCYSTGVTTMPINLGSDLISIDSNIPFITNELKDYIINGGEVPTLPDWSEDDAVTPPGGEEDSEDGELLPPTSAPVVVDWGDFMSLVATNTKTIVTVGCLVLSLIISSNLLVRLYHFLKS